MQFINTAVSLKKMESSRKRKRVEHCEIKEMICTMQYTFFNKMQSIEDKIKKIASRYHSLETKVDAVLSSNGIPCTKSVPSAMPNWPYEVITPENKPTNTEEEFPNGSWLGDPKNPDLHVRCKISEKDLTNINKTCPTPEKLALTLLDHLFDRELQACSNLSGTGKYGKRQLDPYKVFGIKCHVTYIFGTDEEDWNRIKISLDSKCRTQFRRVVRGLPLYVKRKRRYLYSLKRKSDNSDQDNSSSTNYDNRNSTQEPSKQMLESTNCNDSNSVQELIKQESESLDELLESDASNDSSVTTQQPSTLSLPNGFKPEIIHTEQGKFQVIRATKEQLEHLKQNNFIKVVSENCILPT